MSDDGSVVLIMLLMLLLILTIGHLLRFCLLCQVVWLSVGNLLLRVVLSCIMLLVRQHSILELLFVVMIMLLLHNGRHLIAVVTVVRETWGLRGHRGHLGYLSSILLVGRYQELMICWRNSWRHFVLNLIAHHHILLRLLLTVRLLLDRSVVRQLIMDGEHNRLQSWRLNHMRLPLVMASCHGYLHMLPIVLSIDGMFGLVDMCL